VGRSAVGLAGSVVDKEKMITYALIQVFSAVLFAITSPLLLLSNVTTNSSIVSAIATAGGYLGGVPFVDTILSILGSMAFLVTFEAFFWAYKGIRWLYRKIPGVT
jgi:hypothetical protein